MRIELKFKPKKKELFGEIVYNIKEQLDKIGYDVEVIKIE